jgi:hypothetical protein
MFKPGNKAAVGHGRPKGSVTIFSRKSAEKLMELGFDPIQKMAEQHDRLLDTLADMYATGKSLVAIAQLESTIERLANNLVRYGYARIPEPVQVENSEDQPNGLQIVLTTKAPEKE